MRTYYTLTNSSVRNTESLLLDKELLSMVGDNTITNHWCEGADVHLEDPVLTIKCEPEVGAGVITVNIKRLVVSELIHCRSLRSLRLRLRRRGRLLDCR